MCDHKYQFINRSKDDLHIEQYCLGCDMLLCRWVEKTGKVLIDRIRVAKIKED